MKMIYLKNTGTMKTPTFNNIIEKLNKFWQKNGCIILQPADNEMGAATFHPATFINAITNKPFKAAYTQISKRPFDLKHNENSNKNTFFHQYQVVIKPSNYNIQDLYLLSLRSVGINIYNNDIKFIEDNWSSPTLGATGIGWEIRLNGIEVTQFTYFQQMGGIECNTTMVEIAYGLERLALHIQKISNINEIIFDNTKEGPVKYGEIFNDYEKEYNNYIKYNIDIDTLDKEFNYIESKITKLLNNNLTLISYDYLIKLSHIFNLIDSRITHGFTRQNYISRIKCLAEKIAHCIKKNDK